MKLYERSFERTPEFREGRHTFVGPPGYKEDLELLYHDIKAKTHEVLIKIFEKKKKIFMEVRRENENTSQKRKDDSPEPEERKKPRLESPKPRISKNKVKRNKIERNEETILLNKLKSPSKEEVIRNPREEAELEVFKEEVGKITFDGKWSKSNLEVNELGKVCAKVLFL